jgi:peptidyl-prolyl cis-trans isomerase A (cyclophilin A)
VRTPRTQIALSILFVVIAALRAAAQQPPATTDSPKPALPAKPTQIVVETSPGAQVYLDGAFQGQAGPQGQLVIENPQPGGHNLRVSLTGKYDFRRQIAVEPEQISRVQAPLADVADATLLHPALLNQRAPDNFTVKVTTTKGSFTIQVTRAWSPLGADRFYNLVQHHYYDLASFFRVLPQFVAQFGISADPDVNVAWQNALIKDDPVTQHNFRGTLTFARGGPNTRTTQVFINLVDNRQLDSLGFSPFGKVTEGMKVVDQLYSGYGDGAPQGNGPSQVRIKSGGKAYLDRDFPKLDKILTMTLEPPPSASILPQ